MSILSLPCSLVSFPSPFIAFPNSKSMDKENEIQIGANAIEDNENSDSIHASGKDEGVVEEMEIVEVYEESNKADGMSLVERSL